MTRQQAIEELVDSYVATFGEEPDSVTGMVIIASAQRVVDGEWFRWVQAGSWRKLEWNPTDENLKCMQPGFIASLIEKVGREDADRKTTPKAD